MGPWERSGQMKIALKVSSEEELCDFHTRAEKRDLSCYTAARAFRASDSRVATVAALFQLLFLGGVPGRKFWGFVASVDIGWGRAGC